MGGGLVVRSTSERTTTQAVQQNYVQRLPPDRLVVQRSLFAGPDPDAPDDLYCVLDEGVAERERGRLVLDGHARASTNTYFGRFPASYWQRWTSVRTVELSARVSGTGLLRLVASDSFGQPRSVATRRVQDVHGEPVTLTGAIDRFVDGGALWLEMETSAGRLTVEEVRWSVPERGGPIRPTAVVICTYNRPDDCVATLSTLASDPEVMATVGEVYVIDQGTDAVDSRAVFPEVAKAFGTTLRYIRQPNLGGAGGFTRGMYEALGRAPADGTDLLLMDDDIRLEPDTVLRLSALAGCTAAPVLVGGQMLKALHPNRLHVGAERADLAVLRAGKPVGGALADADVTELRQEVRVDAAYNGWWACLIPSEVVAAIGYPLPLFFQWDDIEYGLRAGEAGFPTVTLAGAGVWHADFNWKNWDDWSRYFSFRNALITSALHSDFDRKSIVDHLGRQLLNYLVTMRYGLAATMLLAVEDFLQGPDVLRDGGAEAAAAVRRMRSAYPETANHHAHDLPDVGAAGPPLTPPEGPPSMPRSVLVKRVAWQVLRKRRGTAAIADADAYWWHVSLFETAVVTDPSQEGVRIRRFDRELMFGLARRGAAVLGRLAREGGRVSLEYRSRLPEFTSRATWARLYGTQ
jgi:galactofuranosylgalactofuranosylrhamnosyl-N-acetylglucosaminyl-diphospho-decaprenol beta-1,5/1,6-galactofuranosyltransferase